MATPMMPPSSRPRINIEIANIVLTFLFGVLGATPNKRFTVWVPYGYPNSLLAKLEQSFWVAPNEIDYLSFDFEIGL